MDFCPKSNANSTAFPPPRPSLLPQRLAIGDRLPFDWVGMMWKVMDTTIVLYKGTAPTLQKLGPQGVNGTHF